MKVYNLWYGTGTFHIKECSVVIRMDQHDLVPTILIYHGLRRLTPDPRLIQAYPHSSMSS